jgi:phage shock protein A
MSFFERLLNLFKGSVDKGVSKLETPEILAEQAQTQLEANVKSLTDAVTAAIGTQKSLEQQIQKDQEELSTWEKRAAVAVQNNNDDVAKQCLERKQTHKQNVASMTAQLEEHKKTIASLKRQFADAEEQLRNFNIKKQGMIARAKAAESQAKANDIISASGGSSFDKLEEKIRGNEIKNEALNEMSGRGKVDEQFKDMDKNAALDDELAALKAKVSAPAAPAIAASDVKLIVAGDGASDKANSHENVPMIVDVEVSRPDDKGK